MSAPTTWSMAQIYRALGVRSAIQPNYGVSQFNPVAVVADFSNTFAPEQIEARGLLHRVEGAAGVPGTWKGYQLHALSPGGLVVEELAIGSDLAGYGWYQIATIDQVPGGGGAIGPPMSIGGQPLTTRIEYGKAAPSALFPSAYFALPVVCPTDRMFVPCGSYLYFGVTTGAPPALFTLEMWCVWREIPEQLGAP